MRRKEDTRDRVGKEERFKREEGEKEKEKEREKKILRKVELTNG